MDCGLCFVGRADAACARPAALQGRRLEATGSTACRGVPRTTRIESLAGLRDCSQPTKRVRACARYDLDFKGGAKKDLSKIISGTALADMCVSCGAGAGPGPGCLWVLALVRAVLVAVRVLVLVVVRVGGGGSW